MTLCILSYKNVEHLQLEVKQPQNPWAEFGLIWPKSEVKVDNRRKAETPPRVGRMWKIPALGEFLYANGAMVDSPERENEAATGANASAPPAVYFAACGALCDVFWWARHVPAPQIKAEGVTAAPAGNATRDHA